jgi:hypothetical protein
MSEPREPIFYTLPAYLLGKGMSTADGQDILDAEREGRWIIAEVYTPRLDDLKQDELNREDAETRWYSPTEPVELAVFPDTEVDGSRYPEALPLIVEVNA